MSKAKKTFLIIWLLNLITIIGLFIYGRIENIEFLKLFEFKFIRVILSMYMVYDYFKFNLEACEVDSKFLYVLCLMICVIFLIAGITFIIKLDYFRISEFSFFIILSITFRLLSIFTKVPNFLLLKEK